MRRFLDTFPLLARQPGLGHMREDLSVPALRFWPLGAYLVIYVSDSFPLEIVAVVHGAQDVPTVLNRR